MHVPEHLLSISSIEQLRVIGTSFNGSQLQKARKLYPTAEIFKLLDSSSGSSLREKAFRLITKDPGCHICGDPTTYLGKKGYSIYCGRTCQAKDVSLKSQQLQNRQKTMLERYGVSATLASPELRAKVERTTELRHGAPIGRAGLSKRLETNKARYGGASPYSSATIAKKGGERRTADSLQTWIKTAEDAGFTLEGKWEDFYLSSKWICRCGNTFTHSWSTSQRLPICRRCQPQITGTSRQEEELAEWINAQGIDVIRHHRLYTSGKQYHELDIFLPDRQIAIEFNGLYWHSELAGKDHRYHLNKLDECTKAGIQLIQVFEHEWEHRKEICQSVLAAKLGLSTVKLQARKLKIKKLSAAEMKSWFEKTHLAGHARAAVAWGLEDKINGLVAAASFTRNRFGRDKSIYELVRFSVKPSCSIAGGLSRLLSAAGRELGATIRTFCDRRWGTGGGYISAGMKPLGTTAPSYWYFTARPNKVFHRSQFQKKKLQELLPLAEGTEWQLAQQLGLNRFWDCGNLIFERKHND